MNVIQQWMHEQRRRGDSLYLILDAQCQPDTLKALNQMTQLPGAQAIYAATPLAELQQAGPWLFELDEAALDLLTPLHDAPRQDWGWLASAPSGQIAAIARHWRERLLIGEPPRQLLYRFHDNRVLGRALHHLAEQDLPAYLGPMHAVCYWASGWRATRNPAPGNLPVPAAPAWLSLPEDHPQANSILRENLHRYLLAEHPEAYTGLASKQPPLEWLDSIIHQATQWQWKEPEALHLLLIQTLYDGHHRFPERWHPQPGETPTSHFQRALGEARFRPQGSDL